MMLRQGTADGLGIGGVTLPPSTLTVGVSQIFNVCLIRDFIGFVIEL